MGNTFRSLGASNHALTEREENDYYATEPKATELLLEIESFNKMIWEPACGEGHISEVLKKKGYRVRSSDLIDRGYGEVLDFLKVEKLFDGDIITNPPYKEAEAFVKKALELIPEGSKVALFMGIQFLEGKKRRLFINENPIKTVWVSSSRLNCAKSGDFEKYKMNSARCYAWYIWEKGFNGTTELKWFN